MRYHNLIICGPVVISLYSKLNWGVFLDNILPKLNFNYIYGQNHDFGKYSVCMEYSAKFDMTTMSHDGSETTLQL